MERSMACGALVKQIHDGLEKQINNRLREQDLTMAQFGVLVELGLTPEGELSLKELERRLHVAQSTAAGIVVRLEQKGLVESFGDPEDRRIKRVRMTPKGEACFRGADKDMEATEAQLLSALDPQERETLLYLLQKLCQSLE